MSKVRRYFSNVGVALKWLLTSVGWVCGAVFTASSIPMRMTSIADASYFRPAPQVVEVALRILAEQLKEAGFTRENYQVESWDCDNSALFSYNALLNDILPLVTAHIPEAKNKGFDCGMFSFPLDQGGRHRVAYIRDSLGDITYIESYEINGEITRTLSRTEEAYGFGIK